MGTSAPNRLVHTPGRLLFHRLVSLSLSYCLSPAGSPRVDLLHE